MIKDWGLRTIGHRGGHAMGWGSHQHRAYAALWAGRQGVGGGDVKHGQQHGVLMRGWRGLTAVHQAVGDLGEGLGGCLRHIKAQVVCRGRSWDAHGALAAPRCPADHSDG